MLTLYKWVFGLLFSGHDEFERKGEHFFPRIKMEKMWLRGDDPLQPADGFSQFTRKLIIEREPIASNNGQRSV